MELFCYIHTLLFFIFSLLHLLYSFVSLPYFIHCCLHCHILHSNTQWNWLFCSEITAETFGHCVLLRVPYPRIFFLFYVFLQLCIEQLLYRIKFKDYLFLLFFCLANIYRPSLGKVRLGKPNPKPVQAFNFYLSKREKKTILLRIVCSTMVQRSIFNFDFHLFLKKY